MQNAIHQHCAELERCNQRGGRMLSVFDLLKAGTLDLDLAAYFLARISRGASFMVGANPGGAGKTTVMCALLNFVPPDVVLREATEATVQKLLQKGCAEPACLICHEIGAGPYFAYLWGKDLREYFALSDLGCMLATNLHAEELDEARSQICVENGVPEKHFAAFELLGFLRVEGGWSSSRRYIEKVYASEEGKPHQIVYEHTKGFQGVDTHLDEAYYEACRNFLGQHADGSTKTIEQTRRLVVDFLTANGAST